MPGVTHPKNYKRNATALRYTFRFQVRIPSRVYRGRPMGRHNLPRNLCKLFKSCSIFFRCVAPSPTILPLPHGHIGVTSSSPSANHNLPRISASYFKPCSYHVGSSGLLSEPAKSSHLSSAHRILSLLHLYSHRPPHASKRTGIEKPQRVDRGRLGVATTADIGESIKHGCISRPSPISSCTQDGR